MAGKRVSVYLSDEVQCILEVSGLKLHEVLSKGVEQCMDEILLDPARYSALRQALLRRATTDVDATLKAMSISTATRLQGTLKKD